MTGRLLVFGAAGQLARALARVPTGGRYDVVTCGRDTVDITDAAAVDAVTRERAPAAVINAAAYTAVDAAEDDPDAAFALNEAGARHVATAARSVGAPVLHVSTDYVFDGTKTGAYTESDAVAPLGVYGRSKEAGERAVRAAHPDHVILRTAWVYSPYGHNFVRTMLRVGATRARLTVVDDQVGNPTAADEIARALLAVVAAFDEPGARGVAGTYHFAGAGAVSWCGFAREIFRQAVAIAGGPAPEVAAIPSRDWPTRAPCPGNSQLDCRRFVDRFDVAPAAWPDSLNGVLRELLQPAPDRNGRPT